jgi:hypothetical protein
MTPNHFECQIRVNPPEIDSEINDLLRAISDIDSKHESDLDRIEKAVINRDLRLYLVSSRKYEYELNRQPYVALLNKLRLQQHRQPSAA